MWASGVAGLSHLAPDRRSIHPADRDIAASAFMAPSGGRTWWAHFEFTRINIEPTILRKKFDDL